MSRCPDCNKFVSLDLGDPEIESADVSQDGNGIAVEVTARLIRVCAECGTEIKQVEAGDTQSFTVAELRQNVNEGAAGLAAFEVMLDANGQIRADLDIDWEAEESGDVDCHEGTSKPVGRQKKGRPQVEASIGVTVRATYRTPLPADAPEDAEEPEETTVEFGLSVEITEQFDAFEECN